MVRLVPQNPRRPIEIETITAENEKRSILLKVPIYFYVEFLKMYFVQTLLYIAGFLGILFVYIYVPSAFNDYPKKLSYELSLTKYGTKKSESTDIQTYNPMIFQDMLQELHLMRQTAINLQKKQLVTERRTQSLERMLQTIKSTTFGSAENINDEKTKNMIEDALLIYDADKLGLRDYALETLGGSIISTPNTISKLSEIYLLFGFIHLPTYSNPRVIIDSQVIPGRCYSFEGEQGKVRMKLSAEIFISAVTLEHAARSLLTQEEIDSAPKQFQIKGLEDELDDFGTILGQFTYSIEGPLRQTFLVPNGIEFKPFQYVELFILNNYGNIDSTCIYRLRVHGQQTK